MTNLEVSLLPPMEVYKPPQRVYVQGYTYKLVTPTFVRPPLANTVKLINNWVGPVGNVAKNIWYMLFPPASPTAQTGFLQGVANAAANAILTGVTGGHLSTQWQLKNVTAKDNGSTSGSQATSTGAPLVGTASANPLPPQCAIVISWNVGTSWKGGKCRWYIPGLAEDALTTIGGAQITGAVATTLAANADAFLSNINAASISFGGTSYTGVGGTISYQTGHSPRPTPLFRTYQFARVHERLDSQRRRSGKESSFPAVP